MPIVYDGIQSGTQPSSRCWLAHFTLACHRQCRPRNTFYYACSSPSAEFPTSCKFCPYDILSLNDFAVTLFPAVYECNLRASTFLCQGVFSVDDGSQSVDVMRGFSRGLGNASPC